MSKLINNNKIEYIDNNNQYHRLSGPAVIYPNGKIEYWIHGIKFLNKKEFILYQKNFPNEL